MGRWEEAEELYLEAKKLVPDKKSSMFGNILERLRKLCMQQGQIEKIRAEWLEFKGIRERDTASSDNCIDLSCFYNAALHEDWHGEHWPGNNLATLPQGRQQLDGIEFDVRGVIQLNGAILHSVTPGYPRSVKGLPIGKRARSIHFLHAASWGNDVSKGTEIGKYRVKYKDGTAAEIPIVVGREVLEWHAGVEKSETLENATVAWEGRNARQIDVRLFRTTWMNKTPHTTIAEIDFVSNMTAAAPFLVAITLESL